MFASFWIKVHLSFLRQVYGVFSLIYSLHFTVWYSCYCKKQIDVSVLCVCPLNDVKLSHNIVKVYCGTNCLRLMVPQPPWHSMSWCNLLSIRGQTHKNWRQFVKPHWYLPMVHLRLFRNFKCNLVLDSNDSLDYFWQPAVLMRVVFKYWSYNSASL